MTTTKSGLKRPWRSRWPAVPYALGIAFDGAAKIDRQNIASVMGRMRTCFDAMRTGSGALSDWAILAESLDIAKAIERQGVVRGLHEHLASADVALQAIHQRARTDDGWNPTTLYFHELDALREFVSLYAFQLQSLSRSEFDQVAETAISQIRSSGGKVTVTRDVAGVV